MNFPMLMLILATVALTAFGQLALKLGVMGAPVGSAAERGVFAFLFAAAASPAVWAGLAIYTAGVVLWLWILSKTELSLAYPFLGIGFLITMILGVVVLHEGVTPLRIAGTVLISVGCVLVARSV